MPQDTIDTDSRTRYRQHRFRRIRRAGAVAATLAALAALAAACSSDPSGPAVAGAGSAASTSSSGSSSGGSGHANILAFSQCMRAHGITDFPDPTTQSGGGAVLKLNGGSGSDLNPNSPQFQAAQKACKKDMPGLGNQTPAQQAHTKHQMLAYASCMRAHGITDFPDPTTQSGGGAIKIAGGSGGDLNPNSPQFQAAQKACQKDMPGLGTGGKKLNVPGSGGGGAGLQAGQ